MCLEQSRIKMSDHFSITDHQKEARNIFILYYVTTEQNAPPFVRKSVQRARHFYDKKIFFDLEKHLIFIAFCRNLFFLLFIRECKMGKK
jgi:hypothetical protein